MPLAPFLQAGAGLIQSIIGAGRAKKAQNELEGMESPAYTKNQGILDYFNKALSKYNTSPYESVGYKTAVNNTNRNHICH